jgi:hypothetical protein
VQRGAAGDDLQALHGAHLGVAEAFAQVDVTAVEAQAVEGRARQHVGLLVDLLEHVVRERALPRRFRIPLDARTGRWTSVPSTRVMRAGRPSSSSHTSPSSRKTTSRV